MTNKVNKDFCICNYPLKINLGKELKKEVELYLKDILVIMFLFGEEEKK